MPSHQADRNLLFGIMALQMDFITRDQLVAAMNAWALEKNRPLGEFLVAQAALTASRRAMLEPLIDEHVQAHDNNPIASLVAINPPKGITDDLRRQVADPDVLASISQVSTDPHTTRAPDTADYIPPGVRYHKAREHARGNLGVVYIARDAELNREVALKEIQDKHADHDHFRSKFLLEAEITGGLEHPGIVPVYGLGHYEDGRPYYAMRFIKG